MKAFPSDELVIEIDGHPKVQYAQQGMDLRDYFAAKAMPSLMRPRTLSEIKFEESWEDFCAKKSYEYADAMMKAREK